MATDLCRSMRSGSSRATSKAQSDHPGWDLPRSLALIRPAAVDDRNGDIRIGSVRPRRYRRPRRAATPASGDRVAQVVRMQQRPRATVDPQPWLLRVHCGSPPRSGTAAEMRHVASHALTAWRDGPESADVMASTRPVPVSRRPPGHLLVWAKRDVRARQRTPHTAPRPAQSACHQRGIRLQSASGRRRSIGGSWLL